MSEEQRLLSGIIATSLIDILAKSYLPLWLSDLVVAFVFLFSLLSLAEDIKALLRKKTASGFGLSLVFLIVNVYALVYAP